MDTARLIAFHPGAVPVELGDYPPGPRRGRVLSAGAPGSAKRRPAGTASRSGGR